MNTNNALGFFLVTGCLLSAVSVPPAQESQQGIRVTEITVCRNVQDRQPVEVDSVFTSDVGSLCCFTRIEGAKEQTEVRHVWYHTEKKVDEISLPVKAIHWRTYSRKSILPGQTGRWNVVILSENGDPLGHISFTINPK